MDYFSVFANCMTNAGVSFVTNLVIMAVDEKDAMTKSVEHVMKNGTQIVLMMGSPGVPVAVVAMIPFRIERVNRVITASQMPTSGSPC